MSYSTAIFPYNAVVRITDTIGTQSFQASGVLISPDEVLTASHVVYEEGTGTATNIVVTPGYSDGSAPYGSANGAYFHYFPVHDADGRLTNQQSQYDYAVIHLSTPFPSIGFMGLQANYAGGMVNVTGYPGSAGGTQVSSWQFDYNDPYYTLLDGTALGKGSSGGPVWIQGAGGPVVVGVVSSEGIYTGYNTQITSAAFNQIAAWVAQDDATSSQNPVAAALTHKAATFHGARSDYTINYAGNGIVSVTDNVAFRDFSMASINVEALQFTDQPYFIENANGANIARLYSAGLGRIPETAGLFGWENFYNANVSAALKAQGVYVSLAETSGGFNGGMSIADGIINSPEFAAKYGALSDQAFVTQLYQNVLNRGPDAAGLNGWLTYMTPGNPSGSFSRGMVVVGFAESAENVGEASAWMTDMSRSG